jgi:hypothetical protein
VAKIDANGKPVRLVSKPSSFQVKTTKEELIVGTVAAAAPWIGESALVAIAVPPSEPTNEANAAGSGSRGRRGCSSGGCGGGGGGSSSLAAGLAAGATAVNGEEEEDDILFRWEPSSTNGAAVAAAQACRTRKEAVPASTTTSPHLSIESDPVFANTALPLGMWTVALLVDEDGGNNCTPHSLFSQASSWLDVIFDMLSTTNKLEHLARAELLAEKYRKHEVAAAVDGCEHMAANIRGWEWWKFVSSSNSGVSLRHTCDFDNRADGGTLDSEKTLGLSYRMANHDLIFGKLLVDETQTSSEFQLKQKKKAEALLGAIEKKSTKAVLTALKDSISIVESKPSLYGCIFPT